MAERRLIVVGPLPPPVHGVAVSTGLVLANPLLNERFVVEHLDTSDHRPGASIGRWDARNVRLGLQSLRDLRRRLNGRPGVLYLPLSQSAGGVLRDSFLIRAAARRRWRVAVHLRGGEFDSAYAGFPTPLRAWVRGTLARLTSAAVMGDSLRGVFGGLVPPERIEVVPNGTPDPLGVVPDHSVPGPVLFLSSLRERKGVAEAVQAAVLVLGEVPEARFVFAGEWRSEGLRRALEARAEEAGDAIRFLPPVDEVGRRRLLEEASLLLFPPTLPEGHPRVVIEALAAGLPVVTTDRGTIAETVVDGECGFVLAAPNPAELAARIVALLRDDPLRLTMSAAARRRYEERYTQETADRRLADWLEAVAG